MYVFAVTERFRCPFSPHDLRHRRISPTRRARRSAPTERLEGARVAPRSTLTSSATASSATGRRGEPHDDAVRMRVGPPHARPRANAVRWDDLSLDQPVDALAGEAQRGGNLIDRQQAGLVRGSAHASHVGDRSQSRRGYFLRANREDMDPATAPPAGRRGAWTG